MAKTTELTVTEGKDEFYPNWKESDTDVPASYWASRASWNLWMLA